MPHLAAAFERSQSPAVGMLLVKALSNAPGRQSVSADTLNRIIQKYPAEVHRAAEPLFKQLEADVEKQKARLTELEPVLTGGNARGGKEIFFGKKVACSACHTVQSQGGQVGPDLSKIGAIRSGRDLLAAIVFPSASFARGYEPYVVTAKSGKFYPAGILRRETAEAIYLTTRDRAEIRIPRSEIETLEPGRVSIMPEGLDGQLSRQELADLIAFLLSLK
jgi:putative heme-binding domain-containing protein